MCTEQPAKTKQAKWQKVNFWINENILKEVEMKNLVHILKYNGFCIKSIQKDATLKNLTLFCCQIWNWQMKYILTLKWRKFTQKQMRRFYCLVSPRGYHFPAVFLKFKSKQIRVDKLALFLSRRTIILSAPGLPLCTVSLIAWSWKALCF